MGAFGGDGNVRDGAQREFKALEDGRVRVGGAEVQLLDGHVHVHDLQVIVKGEALGGITERLLVTSDSGGVCD